MTTRIDRAITEVIPEPEPSSEGEGDPRWDEVDRLRNTLSRVRRLELRTRAEGFDD